MNEENKILLNKIELIATSILDLPKEQSPCYCCEVINGHRPDCPYFILQDIISEHNMIVTASGQPKTGGLLDK